MHKQCDTRELPGEVVCKMLRIKGAIRKACNPAFFYYDYFCCFSFSNKRNSNSIAFIYAHYITTASVRHTRMRSAFRCHIERVRNRILARLRNCIHYAPHSLAHSRADSLAVCTESHNCRSHTRTSRNAHAHTHYIFHHYTILTCVARFDCIRAKHTYTRMQQPVSLC